MRKISGQSVIISSYQNLIRIIQRSNDTSNTVRESCSFL